MLDNHLKNQSQQVICNVFNYLSEEKDNGGPLSSLSEVYKRVAAATGVGLRSIQTLNAKCKRGQELSTPGKRRPNSQRRVIAVDDVTKCKIRQIIYDLNIGGSNLTLNRILSTIRDNGVAFEGGRTSLGTLLKQMSMRWLKANNRRLVLEHRDVVAARRQFLRRLKENRQLTSPRPIVYVHEMWVNLQAQQKTDFINGEEVDGISHGEGDCTKKCDSTDVRRTLALVSATENGFLEGTGQLLLSGQRTTVIPEIMCEKFEKWMMSKLIPSLPPNSIIVINSELFHNTELDKSPSSVSSKAEIVNWLQKNGVCCTSDMIKAELLQLVNRHKPNKRFQLDDLLDKHGHTSLRLPSHHRTLNPLELILREVACSFNKKRIWGKKEERYLNAIWNEALTSITEDYYLRINAEVRNLENEYWNRDNVIDNLVEQLILQGGELSSDDSDSDVSDVTF